MWKDRDRPSVFMWECKRDPAQQTPARRQPRNRLLRGLGSPVSQNLLPAQGISLLAETGSFGDLPCWGARVSLSPCEEVQLSLGKHSGIRESSQPLGKFLPFPPTARVPVLEIKGVGAPAQTLSLPLPGTQVTKAPPRLVLWSSLTCRFRGSAKSQWKVGGLLSPFLERS